MPILQWFDILGVLSDLNIFDNFDSLVVFNNLNLRSNFEVFILSFYDRQDLVLDYLNIILYELSK